MSESNLPYREKDILTEAKFLKFCKNHGLRLDKNDLAFFDGLGLISPVVRPPEGKEGSSAYYSPYQLYILRRYPRNIRHILQNGATEADHEAVAVWYKRFEFLMAVEDLHAQSVASYYNLRHGIYIRWLKDQYSLTPESLAKERIGKKRKVLKQEIEDLSDNYRDALDVTRQRFKPKAKRLVQEYVYSENDVLGLSRDFMNEGSLARNYSSLEQRIAYAKTIEMSALIKYEHPYRISCRLLWLYSLIRTETKDQESQEVTFAGELMGNQGTHCIYCGKAYSKRQYNQRTCGSDACRKADSNAIKNQKRTAGLYAWH